MIQSLMCFYKKYITLRLSTINLLKWMILVLFISTLVSISAVLFTANSIATTDETPSDITTDTLPSPPSGFCQTKTDYDATATCSNASVTVNNMAELQTYQSNFGLSGSRYKSLRIGFALTGSTLLIHSPCSIMMTDGLTHTATNLCLDGKKEVMISPRSVFMSEKIHILSMDGNSIVQNATVLRANELEIFSSGKVHINQGVRLNIRDNTRLVSTYSGDAFTGIRFGPGSQLEPNNLTIIGYGGINFNSMSVTAKGALSVESKGIHSRNKINIVTMANIRAQSVSIISGNIFELRQRSFLRAEANVHVQALGCLVQRNTTIEASTYSGSCLNASRVNQIPVVVIGATPSSGLIPLAVSFNSIGTNDPDGTIRSYTWTFPDDSTSTGTTASRTFSTAGAHSVKLTVVDNDGAQAEKEIVVMAMAPMVSPTASFTFTPSMGEAPLTVSFDGSASSDPDGSISTYEWIFSDGETLTGGPTNQRTFSRAGEYTVSLRVTDDDGLTHQTDSSTITVIESNQPPMLVGDQSFQVMQNKPLGFTLNGATDPDNDSLTYFVVNNVSSGTLSGCLDRTSSLACTYTPADNFVGQVTFTYKANDGQRDSETMSLVTLNVVAYNTKPIANAGMNQNAHSGDVVTLDGSASSDLEMQTLTYRWELPTRPIASRAQLANSNTVSPVFIADRDGAYIARLIVNDGKLDSSSRDVTITVTGEANTAPVLTAITSPQTLQIGTELRFTIAGTDADMGDTLTFRATGLPKNAKLDGETGKFRFQPEPTQVGSHTVTFTVTDGRDSHSLDVILRVQAPAENQATALKSKVIDANAYSATRAIVPIAGVRITVEGSTATATTNALGAFTISGITHGAKIVSLNATGLTAPNGHKYANFSGRLKIFPNTLNRPLRDYMLPRVNPTQMAMVMPNRQTVVNNTDIGVSMTVPSNTAMNSDGTMYSGPLSVSMVPTDATPRELPEIFNPSFIITLQPVGISFARPVPITFPNTDNQPAGTFLDIFSLSERGGFEKVGIGQVSTNGRTVNMVDGGVRSTTWHFPAPMVPSFNGNSSGNGGNDNNNNGDSNGCQGGSTICMATGMLGEMHSFPGVVVSGQTIQPTFFYKNAYSLENLTVRSEYRFAPVMSSSGGNLGGLIPTGDMNISFELQGQRTPKVYFNTTVISDSRAFATSQQLSTEGFATGAYQLITRVGLIFELLGEFGLTREIRSQFDQDYHGIVSPKTDFGMGWRLSELQSLHGLNGEDLGASPERVMLVYGDFKYLIFIRNEDGTYASPDGDYSTFKALPEPVGGFTRQTKSGRFYFFNREGQCLGMLDRYGRKTSYTYLPSGKLFQIIHDDGSMTTLTYGSDGLIETLTDPIGRIARFIHNSRGQLTRITDFDNNSRGFEYSSGHSLIAQTDKLSRATNYAYDKRGNLIQVVRPDQSLMKVNSYNSKFIAQGEGTPESMFAIAYLSALSSDFTDSRGNTTRFKTNAYGAMIESIDPLSGKRTLLRSDDNNITSLRDKNGNTHSMSYDDYGNLTSYTTPVGTVTYGYMTNPADNFHQPISITDMKEQIIRFEYDSWGNVIRTIDPEHNVLDLTYDKGYLLESVMSHSSRAGMRYQYNSKGLITSIKDIFNQSLATMTYDNAGRMVSQSDALRNTETRVYDSLNRLTTLTDARSGITRFNYDAESNLLSLVDPRNHTTSFTYDGKNRRTQKTDPLSRIERFSYDANGNLIATIDKNGDIISYEYDPLNRLTRKIFPDGTNESYTYDPKGNMLSVRDPDSSLAYTYDAVDRATKVSTMGSSSQPNIILNYTYDKNNNIIGLMDSRTRYREQIYYEYDKNNNMLYLGQLSERVSDVVRFHYDSIYRLMGISYPNQVLARFSYKEGKLNQLKSLEYGTSSDSDSISSFSYTYNLNDYVTGLQTSRGSLTTGTMPALNSSLTYGYDTTNQLTSATKPIGMGAESFTYDLLGNRLRKEGETTDSSYNSHNQLTSDKKFTYTYDKKGNLITRTNTTTNKVTRYKWDYKNQLIGVTEHDSAQGDAVKTISYRYDPFGRRIYKDIGGTITKYVYNHSNIFLEFDGIDILKAKYIHGNGVDQPLRMERYDSPYRDASFPDQYFYYHTDRLGNITDITNYAGDVVQRYVYDAFGGVTIYDNQNNVITPDNNKYLKNPFTYTGREYDSETGLYYYRARYYNAEMGRFLSEDPVGFDGGDGNLYRYVGNNAVNFLDSYGEKGGIPPATTPYRNLPRWRRGGGRPGSWSGGGRNNPSGYDRGSPFDTCPLHPLPQPPRPRPEFRDPKKPRRFPPTPPRTPLDDILDEVRENPYSPRPPAGTTPTSRSTPPVNPPQKRAPRLCNLPYNKNHPQCKDPSTPR